MSETVLRLKDWYPFILTIITFFGACYGVIKYNTSRLDKKTDKDYCKAMSEIVGKEFEKGNDKFNKIQESLYTQGMLLAGIKAQVEGMNKKLDKMNGN